MARDYVFPILGERRLVDVRPQDIGWTLEQARQAGLSAQSVKHVYALIHKIFEDAVEHFGWLGRNPCLGRYRPKVPRRERAFLSPAQSMQLLEFTRRHYLGPAIWFQILAGLRNSEVQALRWNAIDWERGQILIRAAQFLEELKAERREPETAFIAQSETGEMLSYETYLRALARLCEEAGVPKVTPHDVTPAPKCTCRPERARRTSEDCSTSRASARPPGTCTGRTSVSWASRVESGNKLPSRSQNPPSPAVPDFV